MWVSWNVLLHPTTITVRQHDRSKLTAVGIWNNFENFATESEIVTILQMATLGVNLGNAKAIKSK